MWDWIKIVALGVIALLAAIAANFARDLAYHGTSMGALSISIISTTRTPL